MSSNGHDTHPEELLLTEVGPVPVAPEPLPTLEQLVALARATATETAVTSRMVEQVDTDLAKLTRKVDEIGDMLRILVSRPV